MGFLVFGEGGAFGRLFFEGFEEFFAIGDALFGEVIGAGESGGSGFEVGEVNIAVGGAEEAGTS